MMQRGNVKKSVDRNVSDVSLLFQHDFITRDQRYIRVKIQLTKNPRKVLAVIKGERK
jgi:hypothetical protein